MALLTIKPKIGAGTIEVVNKRKITTLNLTSDVYIGRPSPLGNPFTVENHGRDRCIEMYDKYICTAIEKSDTKVCNELSRIAHQVLDGKHVRLVCWCAPSNCHGNVIKRIIEEKLKLEEAR